MNDGLDMRRSLPLATAGPELRFVKIGARAVGIIEDEFDALIEELRRERDRRP